MTSKTAMLFIFLTPAIAYTEISAELGACLELANEASRLSCYDDLARSVGRNDQPETGKPVDASSEDVLAADFGKEARLEEKKERLSELTATVVSIDVAGHDKRIFVLDNNQVWAEMGTNARLKVESGNRVRIQPGSLGSFRLFVEEGKVSTRVERIK